MGYNGTYYGVESPVECFNLNLIAIYCIVVVVLSLIFNSLLIVVFYVYKDLSSPLNPFIITLTIFNLVGTLIEFPFVIVSNFYCK